MTRPVRNRSRLLLGCASAALALALTLGPQQAAAQGIDATGNVVFGSAEITDISASETLVEPFSPTVVINWTPSNAGTFIRTGAIARFQSQSPQLTNFAVLNRILPDTNGNVAVIDGTVIARVADPTSGGLVPGGFVAFYSPTGILVGNNASFDVGQLLLTTLDVSSADFQNFAEFGGTMTLSGAQGSRARIQINSGARITATPANSFFAVVAADVQMLGTATINGSHAYVAGEVVGLRFSNGLFDITVPVGTAAGGTVMELAGNIGGPASNGVGDNHLIYALAAAQADPISMIFRGNLGFAPAQSASIVNGEIILSANYNVSGRTVDGGSISDGIGAVFSANSATSNTRADIVMEDFSVSSSLLAIGTHSVRARVESQDGFVRGNLLLVGRENAELTASNGYALDISGDVLVSAQDYGLVSSSYQTLAELDATGGTALIEARGSGQIRISGNVLVAADAFAGFDTLNLIAGSAQGGQARIGASGGRLTINRDVTVTARGLGPNAPTIVTGAPARAGLAQSFAQQGGEVTLGGSLALDARATGANVSGSTVSDAYGGTALLTISDGGRSIAIARNVFASASATGGSSNNAGAGSLGDAGEAIVNVDGAGQLSIGGQVVLEAEGRGGANDGGTGGIGLGGRASSRSNGGTISIGGNTIISSNGFGGPGNVSDRAGDGFGGTSALQALGGGTLSLATVQVMANGFGAPAIGFPGFIGGNGTGGDAEITASGSGSQISIARNLTTQQESAFNFGALLSASGVGGRSTGGSGVGGTGRGGTVRISATQGASVALPADPTNDPDSVGAIRVYARGIGGNSTVSSGTGGAGRGGSATIEVDGAGSVIGMGAAMVSVSGIGGSGSNALAGRIDGGEGRGGSALLTLSNSATANLANFETEAGGTGGDGVGQGNGGNGFGGSATTALSRSTLHITGRLGQYSFAQGGRGVIGGAARSVGQGSDAAFRAEDATITFAAGGSLNDGLVLRSNQTGGTGTQQGGTAEGGSLELGLRNTTVTGELDLTIEAQAAGGRGAAAGGNATGSAIDIAIRNSDLEAGRLRAVTTATGGEADPATGTGGDAYGGNITLFTNPSRIGLVGANTIASIAQGGNAQIGGSAFSGDITGELNQTELTVSGALSGAGLELLSQASAGQGQETGSNMGNATSGTVSLQLSDSALFAEDIRLRTNASAESAIPEIGGGTATTGSNLLELSGTSRLDAGNLLLDSTAATSFGQRQVQIGVDQMGNPIFGTVFDFSGLTTGGVSRILLAESGTPQINATFIDVIADTFGALFDGDRAGRFSIEVLSGGINALGLNARTPLFSSTQGGGPSQVIVRGGELIARNAYFTTGEDLLFITSEGGFIGDGFLSAEAGNNITVIGEGADRGVIEGATISFNAGRSILLDGTLRSADGTIALTANSDFTLYQFQPQPAVIMMSPDARIVDEDGGSVSISILDGAGNPQRETGPITLGQITAGTISVRHFGSSPGSDIIVRGDGVLTASGGGRAIDLASLNGEVINLAGDAGLILTGSGHYGIFAATPTGSQIGSPANYTRRYNVLTEAAYDALDPGGNFAAFRISPVLTVTANNATRVYGDANPQFTASITGFLPGDGIADLSGAPDLRTVADVTSDVGTYAIEAALGSLQSAQGYSFAFNPGVLTITPRPITVTADNLSRLYGAANPPLTFTIGGLGLVNGDQLTGALATTAGPTTGVGSVPITQGTLAASANYELTFNPGVLTITPRLLIVAADDQRKLLGQPDPPLTFRLSGDGLVNGDQLSGSLARDPGETIGSYAIRQGSLSAGANYRIEFTPGTLTIDPPPAPPELTNPTLLEPTRAAGARPPVFSEGQDRFGIDFPEQPDALFISEDPLLDDPVTSGGDASLYAGSTSGEGR